MLDNISGGRVILGIGRGAGKVEFDGFRLDMGESRERFVEAAQAVLGALENGYMEYDGAFCKQPKKRSARLHSRAFETAPTPPPSLRNLQESSRNLASVS